MYKYKKTSKLMVILLVAALAITMTGSVLFAVAELTPAKKLAFDSIDRNKDEIAKIGNSLYWFSELGMQEYETCELLSNLLTEWGFKVERNISEFPTAFMATYGSGKPVIAVHTESDCVPSANQRPGATGTRDQWVEGAPGHGEGHNEGPAAMLGGIFAVKQVMDKYNLKGTLKVFLAPAEEQLVSRPFFVRDGYFDDVDVVFHPHVSSSMNASYGIRQYALISVEFAFFGKTAHGARAWQGNDASDATKLMSIGFDALREHLPPTYRAMSTVVKAGDQPNVIADYAKIWWMFRESTAELVKDVWAKGRKVAEGAAMMTNTRMEENLLSAVWPTRSNQTLAEVVYANVELIGMPKWTAEEQELAKAIQRTTGAEEIGLRTKIGSLTKATQSASANDSGDICWVAPSISIRVPGGVQGTIGHNWTASIAQGTSIANKGEVQGAKLLAASMIDMLESPELVAKAKATFKKEIAGVDYKTLLPADQKPPYFLGEDLMAKYRPLLEPHYLNVKIEFK